MSNLISVTTQHDISVVSINNPPVNALSVDVRAGIMHVVNDAQSDANIRAIIIICEGRTFIAGADIKEFGKTPLLPHLPDVVLTIANSNIPVIAAIHGTVLGGGCEIALACHYRVSMSGTKLGMPEVNLGLIPGAGGTQLLPRTVGLKQSLDMIIGGKPINLPNKPDDSLVHDVTNDNLLECALSFAQTIIEQRTFKKTDYPAIVDPDTESARQYGLKLAAKRKGQNAPLRAVEAVLASTTHSLIDGMKLERKLFVESRDSVQSAAMRYAFFAEKSAEKPLKHSQSVDIMPINKVTVIGAGTMGAGIAMSLLASGLDVYLLEINADNLERGLTFIRNTLASSVSKGRIREEQAQQQLARLIGTTQYDTIADSDLVIEAAFESMAVKQDIFSKLSAWDVARLARHPKRPYTLDYIDLIFEDFEELHGDRSFGDDLAVIGGLAKLNNVPVIGSNATSDI